LRWWQSAQRGDSDGVRRWMTSTASQSVSPGELDAAVHQSGPMLGFPSVVRLRQDPPFAVAYVLVLAHVGEDREPIGAVPISVTLRQTRDGWRVDQLSPLNRQVATR
jgi:hypothetical protein